MSLAPRSRNVGGAPDSLTPLMLNLVGFAMLVGSWFAVSGEPAFARQVGWLNIAVAGAVVAAAGDAAYLVGRRRAVRVRLAALTPEAER